MGKKNIPFGQEDVHVLIPAQWVKAAESAGHKKGQAVLIAMREKWGGIIPNSLFKESTLYRIEIIKEAIEKGDKNRAIANLEKIRHSLSKLAS